MRRRRTEHRRNHPLSRSPRLTLPSLAKSKRVLLFSIQLTVCATVCFTHSFMLPAPLLVCLLRACMQAARAGSIE